MIVQCSHCRVYFDDQFRDTSCPHDTFLANDGQNNFKHYHESYIGNESLGESKSYQQWLNANEIKTMNDKIPPGPEDIPTLGYVRTFKMLVTIFDKDDNVVREQEIDYGNVEHRKWLGRVTYFSCSNGMTVETSAMK